MRGPRRILTESFVFAVGFPLEIGVILYCKECSRLFEETTADEFSRLWHGPAVLHFSGELSSDARTDWAPLTLPPQVNLGRLDNGSSTHFRNCGESSALLPGFHGGFQWVPDVSTSLYFKTGYHLITTFVMQALPPDAGVLEVAVLG